VSRLLSYSLISGLLLASSWPVNGFTPFIFICLIPLLFIEEIISNDNLGSKNLRLFFYSYITFLTWNIATTWWIVYTTIPGAIFANLANSSFYSIIFLLYRRVKRRIDVKAGYLFLITFWITFEKFHLNWDLSWPWLNLGNVFSERTEWIQWYEYTGVFGGSLWVLCSNFLLFDLFKKYNLFNDKRKFYIRIIPRLLLISTPIFISILIKPNINKDQEFDVLITQPKIDPWDTKYKRSTDNVGFFKIFKDLTLKDLNNKKYDFIITPETYFSEGYGENIDFFEYTKLYDSLNSYLSQFENTNLISGIQFYKLYQNQDKKPTKSANYVRDNLWIDYYNSSINLSSNKKFEFNHKSKLVVGSEYMPFKSILEPIIGTVMVDLGGSTVSKGTQYKSDRVLFRHSLKDLKTIPIVCYETIYGEYVSDYVDLGANFITVITNDAWWGNTPGHRHLLSYARLRAIENRRYIVRSANSGVSTIINEIGEYDKVLPFDTKGTLSGKVYSINKRTFYNKNGDYIARICLLLSGLLFLISFSKVKE
tara:strand:+ start:17027 stop:18634 length:1608 start_codon:yes stop_codon:yes gene_type:complete